MVKRRSEHAVPSLFILVFMISVGPFGDTLYTPSLPKIADALSVSYSWVQLTMTSYLAGYAISQLLYGPLSDRFGRRPLILLGAFTFVFASLLCMLATNILVLIAGRFIQGLGACSGAVISSAAVRDAFPKSKQGGVFAKMNIAFAIAPGIGPVVGTFIAQNFFWEVNFILLFFLSAILFVLNYFMFPETLKTKNHEAIAPSRLFWNYFNLFKARGYIVYLIVLGINIGIVYGALVEAPGLLLSVMALSKMWIYVIAFGIVIAFMIGSFICSLLNSRMHPNWILVSGMSVSLVGASIMWLIFSLGHINIWTALLPIIIIFIGVSFVIPIATAKALAPFSQTAGSASAMMGCIQMGLASLITACIPMIHIGEIFTMPVCFSALSLIGIVILLIYMGILQRKLNRLRKS